MSGYLWAKSDTSVNEHVQRFCAGEDVILDRELLPYDIEASRAHVRGLARAGLMTEADAHTIEEALGTLAGRVESGDFVLDERYEDGHSAIEVYLVDSLGEAGKRVHLGRSRNDQVAVATRLWLRARLGALREGVLAAAQGALAIARRHEMDPMPGYTHLQRAVPSSVGLWAASFAESFAEDAELLAMTSKWLDACPLGTAAGYGVNLPLDRVGVSDELAFGRMTINPMHAQASRGKGEVQALAALWQVMQTARRLSWDLSLFTNQEYGFVQLAPEMTTGSSIMPNKRNPDVVELIRASAAIVGGAMAELQQLVSLPSGYHRDMQGTKPPLVRAVRTGLDVVAILPGLLEGVRFDADRMREAIDGPMHATDRAVELSRDGLAFRNAYRQVGEELDTLGERSPDASVAARVSPGACAQLMLDEIERRIDRAGDA